VVGERGITLSGGQKQRISIARAVIKDPSILILDDSLSAVDTRTEEEILQNIQEFLQGKTAIIIAHRISTIKHADQIVVLDDGKIIEQGTHQELLAKKGYYARLYHLQLAETTFQKRADIV
jgi:ATP-binding cassette subfamily B protein